MRDVRRNLELQAARGNLENTHVQAATDAIGALMFKRELARGYFGADSWDKEESLANTEETALAISDEFMQDSGAVAKFAHTINAAAKNGKPIPAEKTLRIIGGMRQKLAVKGYVHTRDDITQVRGGSTPTYMDSRAEIITNWRQWTRVKPVDDFEEQRIFKYEGTGRLLKRSERGDVKSTRITDTGRRYRAANYERSFPYTWEMSKSPDGIVMIREAAREMGENASELESEVNIEAMADGLTRAALTPLTAAISSNRLDDMRIAFHNQQIVDTDGQTRKRRFTMNGIIHGISEQTNAERAFTQQYLDANFTANTMQGKVQPFYESAWDDYMGTDYVGFQRGRPFMEQLFLREFLGGPLVIMKLPNVAEYAEMGSFENHTSEWKVSHVTAATVADETRAIRGGNA